MGKKIFFRVKRKIINLKLAFFSKFYSNKEIRELQKSCFAYKLLAKKFGNYLNSLPKYASTGEHSKKVWWCWLQGEDKAPDICKACLESLRTHLKDREIVVITAENFSDYVDFPEYILGKYKKGYISNTHFSDLLRAQLLVKYGGTWIDSSVLCTGYNKTFFDKDLFVFSNFMKQDPTCVLSSWFITSEKDNPILKTTRDLLFNYWKNHDVLIDYFLFHKFFTMACKKYPNLWAKVPTYSNIPPHVLQFELKEQYTKERAEQIKSCSTIHKLNQHFSPSEFKEGSNYKMIAGGKWGA